MSRKNEQIRQLMWFAGFIPGAIAAHFWMQSMKVEGILRLLAVIGVGVICGLAAEFIFASMRRQGSSDQQSKPPGPS